MYTINWMLKRAARIRDPLSTLPLSHGPNCSCATSSDCFEPITLHLKNGTVIEIPGHVLGCLPIESLLGSTLAYFYNQTCVGILTKYSNYNGFLLNSTIHDWVNSLFVDSTTWKVKASHSTFFADCQPTVCMYTLQMRNSVLFILTSFLDTYERLMKIFRYLVLMMIMIVLQKLNRNAGDNQTLTGRHALNTFHFTIIRHCFARFVGETRSHPSPLFSAQHTHPLLM